MLRGFKITFLLLYRIATEARRGLRHRDTGLPSVMHIIISPCISSQQISPPCKRCEGPTSPISPVCGARCAIGPPTFFHGTEVLENHAHVPRVMLDPHRRGRTTPAPQPTSVSGSSATGRTNTSASAFSDVTLQHVTDSVFFTPT